MNQRTLKLLIAYDGTDYSGWQRQKNAPTIQEEIERKLSVILNIETNLHGSGRTDAGVHAKGMTAHFHTEKQLAPKAFKNGLNSMLPRDIRILECSEAAEDFHARFNAKGKVYSYHIFTGQIQLPTKRLYATHVPHDLDIDAMSQCLKLIHGTHDFTSFEAAGSRDVTLTDGKGAVRTISSATIEHQNQDIKIILQGDGFLRYMVRNIVGTLIEVGRGKRSIKGFKDALEAKDRAKGGATAPAHGLFMEQVLY